MYEKDEKVLMSEAAVLYYEKKLTQQEIAERMNLSRQTVSKLLNLAVKENIVEIIIHNPEKDREDLQKRIIAGFGIKECIVTGVSSENELLRQSMTVKAAAEYLTALLKKGDQKIALSWGRTIQELIRAIPRINTRSTVFPLFGATDNENSFFSSNELTRVLADRIGAEAKYAWFPYRTDSAGDCRLIEELSYYKKIRDLWDHADIALLGIGNTEILEVFQKSFGYTDHPRGVIGDVATHFFNEKGEFIEIYKNTLCASAESIKKAGRRIAVACGDNKVKAIRGALRTGLIDTLITDEYTARSVLENV